MHGHQVSINDSSIAAVIVKAVMVKAQQQVVNQTSSRFQKMLTLHG
jgi:hypothetical protein